jgi:ABC-2 type transport system permease protein
VRKLWLVFKREYLTRVRTKGFVISTIAIPVLIVGYMVIVVVLSTRQGGNTLRIALVDEAGGLAQGVTQNLTAKLSNGQSAFNVVETLDKSDATPQALADLREQVRRGSLDAFLVLPAGILTGTAAEFHTRNAGDVTRTRELRRALSNAAIARRLGEQGIHVADLTGLMRGVGINLVKITRHGESKEGGEGLLVGFILAMMLYSTLIFYGVSTMRSVLEEKTSHIVEVLASSLRPVQLLGGKILGVAAVALTQYVIWTLTAAGVGTYGAAMAASMSPGAADLKLHIPGALLVYLVLYFLAGYFLYAALYAAVGAAVSNEQDAQQLQIPVIMPLILALVFLNFILHDPNSTASTLLSFIPFFTPILMIFRIALQTPPFWQIALSLGLTVLTTLAVMMASARIYRVGILMYGKRPSLVELLRWLRYT